MALPAGGLRPAAFLDRDGVINVDLDFVHRPEDLEFVEGAPHAIRRLNEAGVLVVVVTNQSGVARGLFDEAAMDRFHDHLRAELAAHGAWLDAIYACPYHPEAAVERYRRDHPDRKPAPGMLLRAMADLAIDRDRSFLIGDKPRDVQAAQAAGVRGYLFEGGGPIDAFLGRVLEAERERAAAPR